MTAQTESSASWRLLSGGSAASNLSGLVAFLGLVFAVRLIRTHHIHYKYIRHFGGPNDLLYSIVILQFVARACRQVWNGGHFFNSLFRSLIDLVNRFKGSVAIYIGLEPNLLVYRAEEVETMMTHSENITKPFVVYDMMLPWLRRGLLTSSGSKWRTRRRLLTPTFHFKILDRFAVIMNKHASNFCEAFGERTVTEFNIIPFIERLTLNIICETVMGVNLETHDKLTTVEYLRSIKRIGQLFILRAVTPHQWPACLYQWMPSGRELREELNKAHRFTESVIDERKSYFQNDKIRLTQLLEMQEDDAFQCKRPFMDLLLKEHFNDPNNFTIHDIREEVDTFMFEGHDTTAMALSFALFLLGHHAEVQDKIYDEIVSVLGNNLDSELTVDQTRQLKYLDCVVKECLRLYPSVPIVGRRITKDYQLNGKTAPRGSNVYCFIYQLHRDPRYFPDPEKFDPERFRLENTAGRNPYAYVPFSAGPRNCIGQKFAMIEEKIILTWVLRRYRLESLMPRENLELFTEMVLRSANGLPVRCVPR